MISRGCQSFDFPCMRDLPPNSFAVEYAKSGRAACKKCQRNIGEGAVRLAKMIQSRFFDGVQPLWYHLSCAFDGPTKSLASVDAIHGLDTLRFEDQQKIRDKFAALVKKSDVSEFGRIHGTLSQSISSFLFSTFFQGLQIDYAKSNRSSCQECEKFIDKDSVRIALPIDKGGPFGPQAGWHHTECFFNKYHDLANSITDFSGWSKLLAEDQENLGKHFEQNKKRKWSATSPSPKEEAPASVSIMEKENMEAFKAQSKQLWKIKDSITDELAEYAAKERKNVMSTILKHNGVMLETDERESTLLDALADTMVFGVGEMVFRMSIDSMTYLSNHFSASCANIHASFGIPIIVFTLVPL